MLPVTEAPLPVRVRAGGWLNRWGFAAASLAAGMSLFCWAPMEVIRTPFPGSPAGHNLAFYLSQPVAVLLAVAGAKRRPHRLWDWLALSGAVVWLLAGVVSGWRSPDPPLALAWIAALVAALLCLASGVDRRFLAAGMAVGVGVSLPLMIVQAARQSTWPVAALQGWTGGDLTSAVHGAAVLGADRWLRPYGLTPHPNIAGGLAAGACVLFVAEWPKGRQPWLIAASVAAFSEVLLSFSRAAWIGALIGLAVALWNRREGWRPLAALLAVSVLLFAAAFGGLITQRASAAGQLEADSLSQRVYLAGAALQFWRRQPWLGLGPAQFPQREVDAFGAGFVPEPVHDGPLLVLAESGLAGLAGAGLLAAAIIRRIWRARDWAVGATALTLLAPLLLDHYLLTSGPGLCLLGLLLAPGAPPPRGLASPGDG